jgi:hypothetical protein
MSNNWISVKERLPERNVCVLITDGNNTDVSFFQPTYMGDNVNELELFHRLSPWSFGEISHWQPLPPPPKEEE